IKASVAIGASACERYPALVAEVAGRGWEVLAHGTHATRIISSKMTDAEQRAYIAASMEAVASATGSAPRGWLSQDQGEAPNTPALLADAGIDYLVDWSNDDQAYLMEPGLVSIPPWLFGMAHRIRFLDEALTRLRAIDGLWQGTTGEIASWARGQLEARK